MAWSSCGRWTAVRCSGPARIPAISTRWPLSPDGDLLASAGAQEVILWDVARGSQRQTLAHPDLVITVTWSPQEHLLATGDVQGCIRLWVVDATEPAICIAILSGHTGLVSEIAFAPNGSLLASASFDGTVRLWDVASRRLL